MGRMAVGLISSWLLMTTGCTCPGNVHAVDPASGCCVVTGPRTSWAPCTFTCDGAACTADQPYGPVSATGVGNAPAPMGRPLTVTIDLSCEP